jgi:hypothetical protein
MQEIINAYKNLLEYFKGRDYFEDRDASNTVALK